MSTLGRFLEFSVRTPDILDSLGFYRELGFSELQIGDVWPHKYAVVTDGLLCIGLHDDHFTGPTVTFVQQDLAKHASSMQAHGFEFSHVQLDDDAFNELQLGDLDGHCITMLEARTFSGSSVFDSDSTCGTWFELSLPTKNSVHAARFWAPVAPAVLKLREEPTTHVRFDAGGAAVGLSESAALGAPSLCFRCPDPDALYELIDRHGLEHQKSPGFEGAVVGIRAPEGTMLYAFERDFLGEGYEVEEADGRAAYPD